MLSYHFNNKTVSNCNHSSLFSLNMDHAFSHKRPRPRPHHDQPQQDKDLVPKQYNTRSTVRKSTTTDSSGFSSPLIIRPPTHSVYFLRLHKLFFSNENESTGSGENHNPVTSDFAKIVRFGNVRLQSIYKSPNIYTIDHFLSATDIQYLFTHFISKFKFQRSFVDEGDQNTGNLKDEDEDAATGSSTDRKKSHHSNKSSHRTSAFLALNKQHDSRIASIEQKVASLFGCTTKQIEALQLVRYQSPDQCFHVHHDLGIYDETTGKVELPNKSIWYQRRMITMFCYLNTVPPKNGGATYFPCCTKANAQQSHLEKDDIRRTNTVTSIVDAEDSNVIRHNSQEIDPHDQSNGSCSNDQSIVCNSDGLRIYPMAGRAVVFSNVLASGIPDPSTIHAGEPVIVSRNETVDIKADHGMPLTPSSKSKSKVDPCMTKYGLNIWICES